MKRLLLSLALLLTIGAGCAFAGPPTRVSYTDGAGGVAPWKPGAGVTTQTATSIAVQASDVVVVIAASENTEVPALPTSSGGGLTFVSQQSNATANTCATRVSAGVVGSNATVTITVTSTQTVSHDWGFGVWVYRGSAGIGNSVEQHTTTKTKALTPTGADGAIVWGVFDFAAGVAFTAGTPTPTTTDQNQNDGTHYTLGIFDLTDQVSSGAVSYGVTGGGTTGPFSIVALEVKSSGGGGGCTAPPNQLLMLGVGNCNGDEDRR